MFRRQYCGREGAVICRRLCLDCNPGRKVGITDLQV